MSTGKIGVSTGNLFPIIKKIKAIFPVYPSDTDSVYFDSGIVIKMEKVCNCRKHMRLHLHD